MQVLAKWEIRKQADGKFTVLFCTITAGEEDQTGQQVDVVGAPAAIDAVKALINGLTGTKKRLTGAVLGTNP